MIVILLFVAAFGTAFAQKTTIVRFRTAGPSVKRWGGRILIGVGTWILLLATFATTAKEVLF